MLNYKENLMELLKKSVADLYSGDMVFYEITESGFYCDFDLSEPLNPEKINAINKRLLNKNISCAYEITGFSGAYLDGDASKKMLQRIYVAAYEKQEDLQDYRDRLSRAAEHDHKKLGALLGIFSTSDEVGQGLVLWHPKGAIIRFLLEQFIAKPHTCSTATSGCILRISGSQSYGRFQDTLIISGIQCTIPLTLMAMNTI